MADIQFLSLDVVLQIHEKQIKEKGGAPEILSKDKLKGAISQPKQTFGGQYLYDDLFAMVTAYLILLLPVIRLWMETNGNPCGHCLSISDT